MLRWAWLLTVGLVCSAAQPAGAQDATARQAQEFFQEGLALADAERWPEALVAFERSNKLVPRGSTTYNIANALYRLERPVQALRELDAYDRMPEVRADSRKRARSAELRELLRQAQAQLQLIVEPTTAKVFVDGRAHHGEGSARQLAVNPGKHVLLVRDEGRQSFQQDLNLVRGEYLNLRISLPPGEPVDAAGKKRFVKRPGFWILMGSITAVGVGLGVGLAMRDRGSELDCGTTGACVPLRHRLVSF